MGISAVLSSALSGLHVTEKNLDLVARNIANAETPGYTRKVLNREAIIADTESTGVRARSIGREIDALLLAEYRTAVAKFSEAETINKALEQLDLLLGGPGGSYALDTLFNEFSQSLQELASAPESLSARQEVLTTAQTLAQQLNQTSDLVQRLRMEADQGLASTATEANAALQQIEAINTKIIEGTSAGNPPADLLDERDRQIDRLAALFDIDVFERANGEISIFTKSGISLFDGRAAVLSYDERGTLSPDTLYNTDPMLREVGTITVNSPLSGNNIDLLQPNIVRTGAAHGYATLRDDLLVTAQAQLDEIAAALSSVFSDYQVDGAAATVGAQTGFDIDLNNVLPGNSVTVTTTVSGTTQTYTFIRVDDASQLPLSNDATANPNDTVVGIDFSGGIAAAIAAIDAVLGANVTASDLGGGDMRVLDDGAAGLSDVDAVHAAVTETGLNSGNLQLPLFVVADGSPPEYAGSYEGGPQKRGLSGIITVNPDVLADPTALIEYAAGTGTGDPARPFFLLAALQESQVTFSPEGRIGIATTPYEGTLGDYLRRVVDYQAAQAANAERMQSATELTRDSISVRLEEQSGVNIDRELADLLVLQNAYAANARVLSAVREMVQQLLNVI